jgi:ATP-dependent RNA helicase HrpA
LPLRHVRDQYLPPDHDAFVAAEPPTGRVIVIAPTRAACETIELAVGLHLETFLEQTRGAEIRALAAAGKGFGIVAGTGTGKTLAIRPIAETLLGTAALRVGVVNREREATPDTPTWNVVIVTTGIARRWFQDGDILPTDTLIVDEIHQTSAELELCLALGKRVGCRFIWLSATVDPRFYARYLDSADVLESTLFDAAKRADVKVVRRTPLDFLDDRFLMQVIRERRGVGVFLPTRAGVEEVAATVAARFPKINAAFYHGGEPIRVIRPFLEADEPKPFLLAMTAAGQSALNVRGLDTVVIDDTRFSNVIEGGKNVLTRLHLGANEILQMAGRVHGRVEGGRVFILSDRDIDFRGLRPTEPEFQLAGDSERVAITCADLGVRADALDLPVPLDRTAYREAVTLLERRGIIDGASGRLTKYGRAVEAMPVDRAWAELLVHADDALVPVLSVSSSVDSLHRMTREDRDLTGLIVPGSDHLTAYNVYVDAYARAGYVGEVYGLPRHLFDPGTIERWAEQRGVLVKAIEDVALGMASVYRGLDLPLPQRLTPAGDGAWRGFADLLARLMPFDLVIDERTADGGEARVSRTSVCGSWGAIAGELRYFADRFGVPRASIDGTQIPLDLIRRYAVRGAPRIEVDAARQRMGLSLVREVEYFGFVLEREREALDAIPPAQAPEAARALAEALARGEARHPAVQRNRGAIEAVREVWRRSGGRTAPFGFPELTTWYERALAGLTTMDAVRVAPLTFDPDAVVSAAERARWLALPDRVTVRGREVPLAYELEPRPGAGDGDERAGVARLQLSEKLARTATVEDLPVLDRPLRFSVARGGRGTLRAESLGELRVMLDRPAPPRAERGGASDGGRADPRKDREGVRGRGESRGGRPGRGDGSGGGRGGRGRHGGGKGRGRR